MISPLRDYTNITEQNSQQVTSYGVGEKKFESPRDVTIGPNDKVVVVDRSKKTVVILDKKLKLIRPFGHGPGSTNSKLSCPEGVAVGHNIIAVSDSEDHVVKKYSLKGDYLSQFGTYGTKPGQFNNPQGMCITSKYFLYVVDCGNHRIQVFTADDAFLFQFGSQGFDPGQFKSPQCIAMDSNDLVYVTDYSGISVFREDGGFIKRIGCNSPRAICIAPDDYIMFDNSDALAILSPFHKLVAKIKISKSLGTIGLAINSNGTIFIAKGNDGCLQVIAPYANETW